MEDSVTLCTNCQRQIAASNFVTHSLHCQRNLVKCESCGEAVPRSSLKEHHAEFHALVSCPNCQVKTERPLLEKHQKSICKFRQQNCRYCELEFTVSDLDEHENYCGSRTKLCDNCGEYVMLKFEQLHLDSNHQVLQFDEPGPSRKRIKNNLEATGLKSNASNNNLKKPQLVNGKFTNVQTETNEDVDDLSHMLAHLNKPKVWALPRIGGVAYPLSGAPQRTVSPPPPRRNSFSDDDNEGDLVALPCEFCNAMIPSNQLLLHQTGCEPEISSFGFQRKQSNSQINLTPKETQVSLSGSNSFVNVVDSDDDSDIEVLLPHDPIKKPATDKEGIVESDDTELPCEFCGAGYPPSLLLDHQEVCNFHPKNWNDSPPLNEDKSSDSTAPKLNVLGDPNLFREHKVNRDFNYFEPINSEPEAVDSSSDEHDDVVPAHPAPAPYSPSSSHKSEKPAAKPFSMSWHVASGGLSSKFLHQNRTSASIPCHNIHQNHSRGTLPHYPIPQLAAMSPQNKNKICSPNDHDIGLKSPQQFYGVCRVGNQTEHAHASRRELIKKSVGTQPVLLCNNGSQKVDFYSKTSAPIAGRRSVLCPASFFTHQENPRVIYTHNTKDIPRSLRGLPPNLSSGFGVSSGSVPNPLSDAFCNNRASIATEWNDLNLARPTSATGAIPKAKAGKLNIGRQVNQEVPRPRSSNNQVTAAARAAGMAAGYSHSQPLPRKPSDKSPVRTNIREHDD